MNKKKKSGKHILSDKTKVIPVILSGGMGTRLWPMSRGNYPKQFLNFASGEFSLIQETLLRVNDREKFEKPIIVCNQEHRFLVAEKVRNIGVEDAVIILEPSARNTAPALVSAALYIRENFGETIMVVLPSDHIIKDNKAFIDGIDKAVKIASDGYLTTFGITPEYPETGYGYIKYGKVLDKGVFEVESFAEKPDAKTAKQYVNSGKYAWNSGMFVFPSESYLSEIAKLQPEIMQLSEDAYKAKTEDKDFIRLDDKIFSSVPKLSIDYAVMEGTKKAAVVSLNCGWSDAGAWDSLWKISNKDENGNVLNGEIYNINVSNSYISSENGPIVAAIGLEDVVIVSTKDCVLVTNKTMAQDVKKIVDIVKEKNPEIIENHRQVFRPWGYYDSIDFGKRYQVKRLRINPGEKISLQMHYHRAEHWIVVSGTAKITCDGEVKILAENQSIYIPFGVVHRIENPGKIDLDIIEVQSGSYLGEDDIVRFEDTYGRIKVANNSEPDAK